MKISTERSPTFRRIRSIFLIFGAPLVALICLADARTRGLLEQTFWVSTATAILSVPIGSWMAWMMVRTNLPGRRWVGGILLGALFVPLYLHAAAWDAGFGLQGWFQISQRFTETPWLAGARGAIWVQAVAALPWVAWIVASGLRNLSGSSEDAAALDANPPQMALYVIQPQVLPLLGTAFAWVWITSAGEITATDIFNVRTFAEEIYIGFARDAPDVASAGPSLAVTLGLLGWLTIATMVTLQRWLTEAWPSDNESSKIYPLGKARPWWGFLVWLSLIVLIAIPCGNLVLKLGWEVEQVGAERIRSWSLSKAATLFFQAPSHFREELGWTLAIAELAALAAIVTAIPMAWWASRRRVGYAAMVTLAGMLLAIPGPFLGIAAIRCFSIAHWPVLHYLYDNTIAAPTLVMALRCWPIAVFLLWLAFRTIPETQIESARIAGAGELQRLVWVVLPSRIWAILGTWLITLALASGELTASILVVPPGVTTLPIRIFGLVHYGVEDQSAAACLWNVLLFVSIGILGSTLLASHFGIGKEES